MKERKKGRKEERKKQRKKKERKKERKLVFVKRVKNEFSSIQLSIVTYMFAYKRRCPWCNGYRRRNWTRHEFKSWTDCISHSTNTLGKGYESNYSPPSRAD